MLSVTDPAILFPGISLLFLAYTNRYLALAGVVRQLNEHIDKKADPNRELQINNLYLRIKLIKYMQAVGIVAFLCCISSMFCLLINYQRCGEVLFITSLTFMFISLTLSLLEVMNSGRTLSIELKRTHKNS